MGSRKKKKMTARYSKERIENTKETKSHSKEPAVADTGIEIDGNEEIGKKELDTAEVERRTQETQGEQPSTDQEEKDEQPATEHGEEEEHQNQEVISQKSEDSMETHKKFPWKKAGLIAGGSIVGIAAVVYISGMVYLRDKFFVNTTINGIDASYSTVEEIEQKIADMVKKYSITLSERGNAKETISADQIGYHYVSKGEVEEFKSQQKMYAWPASFFQQKDYYFESSTTFDQDMLYETIDALKCFSKGVEVAPKNAYMKFNGTTYEVAEEKQGKKVSKKKLRKTLSQAIEKSEPSFSLEEEDCYVKPKVTTKDKDLNQLVKNMNKFAAFLGGVAFGTAGLKVLASRGAKKALSANGSVMTKREMSPWMTAGLRCMWIIWPNGMTHTENPGNSVLTTDLM